MRVTKLDLLKPPSHLLQAIETGKKAIDSGAKGMLNKGEMEEAVALSTFLPSSIPQPQITAYLDADLKELDPPREYTILTAREKAKMSACGDKLFLGYTSTKFQLAPDDIRESKCATIASLWMPNATFHAHGNEHGDINKGWTTEDYEVVGGGPAYYIMGNEIYYVEPDETKTGSIGWEIPPGMLHGVFSEDLNNPALAVLRFHRQGLALRSEQPKDNKGWGGTRDEKVYTFASQAAQSMIEIANGRTPDKSHNLPLAFITSVKNRYGVQ